jgi:PIN domain nuclease of toxin-antitoxin system
LTTVLLDTHVIHWWTADPGKVSKAASDAIERADELAASDVSWWELAWLATHGRIDVDDPIAGWLNALTSQIRTVPVTATIALAAATLPGSFPSDPIDRLIYATAMELGVRLVTKDGLLRRHPHPTPLTIW